MTPAITFPSTRDEAWRYTPVDDILARLDAPVAVDDVHPRVSRADVDALAGRHGPVRLVFVNGRYDADASDVDAVPPGLWVGALADAPATLALPDAGTRDDGFQALNRAEGVDAAVVVVDAGATVDEPVHVVHVLAPGDAIVCHPRTIVDAGRDSHVSVIETYCGLGAGPVTNAVTTIRAAQSATVRHARVQVEAPGAVHVGHTRVEQAADTDVRVVSVMVGADIARHAIDVGLREAGANCDLVGLAVPAGRQRHDHVVTVEHAASHCTSRQRFKGVVDGHARSSFSGHVIVRPGTVATDADQSTRNLLLTPTAEADARPWLEILADDVKCTHGATVGRLDDDALFYLRSRGIPLADARTMLIGAFVRDVTDAIAHPSLRDHLAAVVAARVGAPGDAT